MSNPMPQMPSFKQSPHEAASSAESNDSVLSSSFAGESGDSSPDSLVEPTPQLFEPGKNVHNLTKVEGPKRGIEVVANDKGFYNQIRRKVGDKFIIRSEQDFGDWFRCVDPNLEKKRVEFIKAKKARK